MRRSWARPLFFVVLYLITTLLASCEGPVYVSSGGYYGGGWNDPWSHRHYRPGRYPPHRPPVHRPPGHRPPGGRPPVVRPPIARPPGGGRPPSMPSRPRPTPRPARR